ncbi:pteridine reductase [Granulosicoccaceae sp. 1_MG-2023]|nr:pteridine reductase [Granulosicoccaceae sp. 1_MG-2023]
MQTDQQSLSGKTALVTGSALRVGACFNRRLHAAGADVVIHYNRSADAAARLADELNRLRPGSACCVQADLRESGAPASLIGAAAAFKGRLDILVNNGSSYFPTDVAATTAQQWDDLMATNLRAPYFLIQAALPWLRDAHGCVVNMVDINGERPLAGYPVYCAAKAGLSMLTRSLAKELGPQIRVNAIAPGPILWPEGEAAISDEEKARILREEVVLQKMGNPENLADALMFFCLPTASFVTGQVLAVDGGRSL